ncbi:NUDIX hydrolase [Brevundimonas balnearis]|uniref:NUDIX domain-containing protein n=1 Tax=Brevundimonas balnearis TaxID=1572858 RepID=A0ABV6QYB4_9CAUL
MRDPSPFDARQDLEDAPRTGARARPKDAATLILVRRRSGSAEVLMGRRAPGHVFMASKWVFPGGRVERADLGAAAATELSAATAERLERELPARRARALALAAVRETFEETGLILGRPAPAASVAGPWREFRRAGALPDLAALSYIARAITPPGRPRRFDARFFMADGESLMARGEASGELDEIAWLPLDQAAGQDLPAITRFVLKEVAARHESADRPLPFVRWLHGRHQVSYD